MSTLKRGPYDYARMKSLVDPEVIAVVGASSRPGAFGYRTLQNLSQFQGQVYAVNPKHTELLGRPCFPDLESVPSLPDCVILAVPMEQVVPLVERCAALGVRAVIVYASGFAETGTAAGAALQHRLTEIAAGKKLCILGPNCVGLINLRTKAGLHFMPGFEDAPLRPGRTAIVSQSGALGFGVLQAMQTGAGFSYLLASGNACDVDIADHINFLADDDGTRAAICILEGIKDGHKLLQACRRFRDAGKQLVAYKMGRGRLSEGVALSHTGTMVGSHEAYIAAFSDAGALCVDDLDDALAAASYFAKLAAPGPIHGVGVMATSGGAAVALADTAEAYGVPLTPLQPATLARLRAYVPDYGTVGNPTDTTAQVLAKPEHFASCIEAFLDDPGIGALVVPMIFLASPETERRVAVLGEIARRYDKPICVVWMSTWKEGPGIAAAQGDERLMSFFSADHCMRTLSRHIRRPAAGGGQGGPRPAPNAAGLDLDAIGAVLGQPGRVATERAAKQVLAAAGVDVAREELVQDAAAAERAAARIGYPVAIKIESPDITHKSEVGGVRLGIADAQALRTAFEDLRSAVRRNAPDAVVQGVLVQRMVPEGIELVLGAVNDVQFGPLITVGFGGVLVELLQDIQYRLAPVTHDQAVAMLLSLRGAALLTGYRDQPAVDMARLADAVVRVSQLVAACAARIDQVDVNPIIAGPQGAIVVDALIIKNNAPDAGDTETRHASGVPEMAALGTP